MTTDPLVHTEPRHGLLAGVATVLGAAVLLAAFILGVTAGVGAIWTNVTSTGGSSGASASPSPASGNAAANSSAPATSATSSSSVQQIKLVVNPQPLGGVKGTDGQVHDAFVPATFTMHVGTTYQVTVLNYDDMPHTWTSPSLGVNATIKKGSDSSPSTTTFIIRPTKAGTFSWYCATPCDSWSMVHDGYMRGSVSVVAA